MDMDGIGTRTGTGIRGSLFKLSLSLCYGYQQRGNDSLSTFWNSRRFRFFSLVLSGGCIMLNGV
jgi:hypothetical protein